jgi:hypothetical protein
MFPSRDAAVQTCRLQPPLDHPADIHAAGRPIRKPDEEKGTSLILTAEAVGG